MDEVKESKRRYARVNGFFPLLWEKVPDDQVEKEREHFFHKRDLIPHEPWDASGWLEQGEWEPEGSSERESRLDMVLTGIHVKLDLVLNLLMKKEVDPIYRTPPREVNISGAGLSLRVNEPFEKGAFYELKMLLPILPVRVIRALGRVARVSDKKTSGEDLGEVAFEFDTISEEDKEIIIHYTFKRQRELLREKRKRNQ